MEKHSSRFHSALTVLQADSLCMLLLQGNISRNMCSTSQTWTQYRGDNSAITSNNWASLVDKVAVGRDSSAIWRSNSDVRDSSAMRRLSYYP